jgi:dienelactone hydrolase
LPDPVNVTLPTEDPRTNHVTAVLHLPRGDGPFPAVVVLSGCFGVRHDAGLVAELNGRYLPAGVAVLVLDSLTTRGLKRFAATPSSMSTASRGESATSIPRWIGWLPGP